MNVSPDLAHQPSLSTSMVEATRRALQVKAWELSGIVVTRYYRNLLRRYGRSPQALDERSDQKETQFYNHLFSPVELRSDVAVLDIGCGMGGLIEFLHSRDVQISSYLGIDIVDPFVDFCRTHYRDLYRFQCANFVSRTFAPDEKFDLVVNMGGMVSRVCQYEQYIAYCIKKMIELSKGYVVFNVITDVDFSLGNYKHANQIGHITYIPRDTLMTIVDQLAGAFNATFAIRETKIYPDATDAFVCIKLG